MFYFFFKRLFDIALSLTLIILFSPIIILTIFLIMTFDMQNPFFFQERSGINGKKINIIKFQTMKLINGKKNPTKLGKILRLTKIDELPQLLNILKNEMSLIGPRPLYLDFNSHYTRKHKLRIHIKPGLTGLAQIKVRDSTDWLKKFNFDCIYVKKANINLDLYILFKTFVIVFNSLLKKNYRAIESIDYKSSFYEKYYK